MNNVGAIPLVRISIHIVSSVKNVNHCIRMRTTYGHHLAKSGRKKILEDFLHNYQTVLHPHKLRIIYNIQSLKVYFVSSCQ